MTFCTVLSCAICLTLFLLFVAVDVLVVTVLVSVCS
uniref:Uncharacterized protein n=1 Tax=Anguilla anguilla TaxID=7936 RepID=A0A0E9XVH8_ANGAN